MYFEERTRVGVFMDTQWEFDFNIKFFTEMVARSGEIILNLQTKDYCNIKSELYDVRIYLGSRIERGFKFDILFSANSENEYRNGVLVPTLNCSKFGKRS
jgi:3'-phosphoadenosine 5'-phosphosulfate sulfotransferase (PAPS reductase)/FAD synthetase